MAIQLSVAARNAILDSIEVTVGTAARLKGRTGAQPANCAAADSGTVIFDMTLPSDWMNAASGGSKTKLGTWQDAAADASGTPAHYRLYASDGTTCHEQGSVGQGSGDLSLDNTTIVAGQTVTINTWQRDAPNA